MVHFLWVAPCYPSFYKIPSELLEEAEKGRATKSKPRDVSYNIEISSPDYKTYLTKDKEALIVAKAESEGAPSIGVTQAQLEKRLRSIVEQFNPLLVNKNIRHDSMLRYTKHVIRRVKKVEERGETQKKCLAGRK